MGELRPWLFRCSLIDNEEQRAEEVIVKSYATGARRHRTRQRGVYFVEHEDGTRSYIATWKEERPIRITDPLTTRRVTVEKRASTFDEACRLRAEAEVAGRNRQPPRGRIEQLAERVMAAKWFEYWVRR